jgi:hypothetical protein
LRPGFRVLLASGPRCYHTISRACTPVRLCGARATHRPTTCGAARASYAFHVHAGGDILRPLGGALATTAGGCGRWSQRNICNTKTTYCNIQIKHLQHGEIGRQATVLGRGAARHSISAAGSMVTVEHAAAGQAWWRFKSGFENGYVQSGNSRGK